MPGSLTYQKPGERLWLIGAGTRFPTIEEHRAEPTPHGSVFWRIDWGAWYQWDTYTETWNLIGGGGSLTVEEQDGTPSVAGVSSLQFHQADGFIVSQPVAGTALVELPQWSSLGAGLSADVNNFDMTQLDRRTGIFRWDADGADRNVTGLLAPPIATLVRFFHNNDPEPEGFSVIFKHMSGLSDPANRIECSGGVDIALRPFEMAVAYYDVNAPARWRLAKFGSSRFVKGGVFLAPTGASTAVAWRAPFTCTVTNVRGYRVGGTGATINAKKNGSAHLAGDLSLTSADTWMDGGAVQNQNYVAGDSLELALVSVAGNPTEVSIQVDFSA